MAGRSHQNISSVSVLSFLLVLLSIGTLGCLSEGDLTADEHLDKAFELGALQRMNEAEAHALKAAELGSVCAEGFLASLYQPNAMFVWTGDGETRRQDSGWIGVDENKALDWSKRFEASLLNLAEQGNASAMYYVGIGYMGHRGVVLNHLPVNDSLSVDWLEKAAASGHERAVRFLIMNDLIKQDPERKEALLKRLTKAGNGTAYQWLALMYLGGDDADASADRYMKTVNEAIESGLPGVYAWAKRDMDALKEEAEKGNEKSIKYLQIADSLDMLSRLELLPDASRPEKDSGDLSPQHAFCQELP